MQRTFAPQLATAIAVAGAGVIAITPATTALPPAQVEVATVQNIDLMSLSSALIGIVQGLKTNVDTGAASLETGLEHTWETTYLTSKALIVAAQNINTTVTAAVEAGVSTVPVVGPVVAGLLNNASSVVPQSLATLDLALRISTQLAFDAVELAPIEVASVTDFAANTLTSVLSAVPAPLAAASTTSAPLKVNPQSDTDTTPDTAPVVHQANRPAKAVSAAATAANKAVNQAVSSVLRTLHPARAAKTPKTTTSTVTDAPGKADATDTRGGKSDDGAGSHSDASK